ncbi:peptidoglycan-binding protein [Allobacillus sp. GCM10007491]|nr:peptidoglycan-binding protein [Allobacillus saliphilus]
MKYKNIKIKFFYITIFLILFSNNLIFAETEGEPANDESKITHELKNEEEKEKIKNLYEANIIGKKNISKENTINSDSNEKREDKNLEKVEAKKSEAKNLNNQHENTNKSELHNDPEKKLAVKTIEDDKTESRTESTPEGPIEKGEKTSRLSILKENLVTLGFADWSSPTNYFGPQTESAVEEFQAYYGLTVTGTGNEQTLRKITELLGSMIQRGDRTDVALALKQDLDALGYASWDSPTNFFGSQTESAVKDFQKDHDLKATGIAEQKTLKKIQEEMERPVQSGDRTPRAQELKENLVRLGFADWSSPTNYFGPQTESAVEEFQAYYGLTVTGTGNEQTLRKITELLGSMIQRGDRTDAALALKQDLVALGYASWDSPTNFFGSQTESAVKDFQEDNDLRVTGVVESKTLARIEKVLNQPILLGDRTPMALKLKEDLVTLGFANWDSPTNYFGSQTESAVKEFQEYYGLTVDGVAGEQTKRKLTEVLETIIKRGDRSVEALKLKQNLVTLGYATWNPPNNYFGSQTERAIKEYQKDFGLRATGVAEEKTIQSVREQMKKVLQKGARNKESRKLKQNLVKLGFATWKSPNNYFGPQTESAVEEFQEYYNIFKDGMAGPKTLLKINKVLSDSVKKGVRSEKALEIKKMLAYLRYADWNNPTNYFGTESERALKKFQEDNRLPISGIAEPNTVELLIKLYELKSVKNKEYEVTFDRMVDLQMKHGNPKYDGAGKIPADEANVRYYMNPANFPEGTPGYLQFMLLDESANVSAKDLNEKFLKGKGMLENTGSAFVEAGKRYGLNEFYLMEHALHETGDGGSTLALGVGVDKNGKILRDSNGNIIRNKSHKDVYQVVYNFYGYGAHDDNPLVGGVNYGFERGWFTPAAAVIGGAKNISNNYISQGQNTLYKMKWDPDYVEDKNKYGKQYATHIMWAVTQAQRMFNKLGAGVFDSLAKFEVPTFKNQPKADANIPPAPNPDLPPTIVVNNYPANTIGKTTANVNFRRGPSTGYESITLINKNTEVSLIGDNDGNWVKAELNGIEGWIHRGYVESLHLYEVYAIGNVNYRATPAGERKGALSGGDLVVLSLDKNNNIVSKKAKLNGTEYNWIRIRVNANNYWIADNFLKKY